MRRASLPSSLAFMRGRRLAEGCHLRRGATCRDSSVQLVESKGSMLAEVSRRVNRDGRRTEESSSIERCCHQLVVKLVVGHIDVPCHTAGHSTDILVFTIVVFRHITVMSGLGVRGKCVSQTDRTRTRVRTACRDPQSSHRRGSRNVDRGVVARQRQLGVEAAESNDVQVVVEVRVILSSGPVIVHLVLEQQLVGILYAQPRPTSARLSMAPA
ncbi:uncharacterized protein C8Q71DRAFT_285129 [Rhodofomes roseus]|uniref:Uncharacterized protein n=1 Tax=Rhodofomes roseus TaxID=34475 RepID=A0ABQ8K4I1_9APHY|nr:uncharacterized protein C8Q71DRAFT_285129 [Rhodofomes roseus]KAH9831787.1 hypothetical protein C8Q71DRAFT_285129 [Rhodofomes roseus]